MKLTISIVKGDGKFIGSIKEIPAVITEGSSKQEVMENLKDALELYLEDLKEEEDPGDIIERERLIFSYVDQEE
ncbi:type II toxin-antitoxin system HicB family antitoxin [Dyadobacter frigoris]|uniref:Type II toxin-antitoxin system HicB family antitoxin n=1 Tax=Dyadobacter frigoris TaxID=2576211 RepID=A0A4U6D7S3_9BACT|nr:type II toxin-antitoxin system HicB family antitoxin [Dyadobacter frigoris]TKT93510.1 type II toxin-antitoxin system HicB family antitoxin [Dyadobacter frigoris]GLU55758.1 hypothetical protein Dfri01_52190 [Dyadobacter frigoris]